MVYNGHVKWYMYVSMCRVDVGYTASIQTHRPTAHTLSSSTRVEPQATRFNTRCTQPLSPLLAERANMICAHS
jgi:hypothetical protein